MPDQAVVTMSLNQGRISMKHRVNGSTLAAGREVAENGRRRHSIATGQTSLSSQPQTATESSKPKQFTTTFNLCEHQDQTTRIPSDRNFPKNASSNTSGCLKRHANSTNQPAIRTRLRNSSELRVGQIGVMENDLALELETDLFNLIEQTIKVDYQRRKKDATTVAPTSG